MKSKFFGINTALVLAALAVCGTFTSCYEKSEVDYVAPIELPDAAYMVVGNVSDAASGKAIVTQVDINGTMVSTDANGYFEKSVDAGKQTIKISVSGYNDIVRTIYLATVGKGETNVGVANFELTSTVSNGDVTRPGANTPATVAQAEAQKEEVKTAVNDILKTFNGVTVDESGNVENLDVTVDESGNTIINAPITVASAAVGEPVTVSVPTFTGFASSITPESDNLPGFTTTRALTQGQQWLASAEAALGLTYGLKSTSTSYELKPLAGKTITGYNLKVVMANRSIEIFGVTGVVTYQATYVPTPKYESHDSHDQHGNNPNAGGGSGE